MKRVFRGLGIAALVMAGLGVAFFAWVEGIVWLQWTIAGGVVLCMLGNAAHEYESRRSAERDALTRRLANIEQLALDNRQLLISLANRLRERV